MNTRSLFCSTPRRFQRSTVQLGLTLFATLIATSSHTVAQESRDFALERDAVLALSGGRGGATETELHAISGLMAVHNVYGEYLCSSRIAVDRLLDIANEDGRPDVVTDAIAVLANFGRSAFDDPNRSRRAVAAINRGFCGLESLRLVARLARVDGGHAALRRAVDEVFDRYGAEVGRIAALEALIGVRRWAESAILEDLIHRHVDDAAGLREVLIGALVRECSIEDGLPELDDGASGRRLRGLRRYLLAIGGKHGVPGVVLGLGSAAETGDVEAMLTLAGARRRGGLPELRTLHLTRGVDAVLQRAKDGQLKGDRQAVAASLVVVTRRLRISASPQWVSETCAAIESNLLSGHSDPRRADEVFIRIALQELQGWVTKREQSLLELVQWSCIVRYYEDYKGERVISLTQAKAWYLDRFGWDELAAVPNRDPWGDKYELEGRKDQTRAIVSAGADGIRGTFDDSVYGLDG